MKFSKYDAITIFATCLIIMLSEHIFSYHFKGLETFLLLIALSKYIKPIDYRSSKAFHGVKFCAVVSSWNEEILDEELHIECRMQDGKQGPFVVVDAEHEPIADAIAHFLNGKKK
jgi:hypothetical protein